MKILIIQTAFLGDVVLATALLEKLHKAYPNSNLDMLVRKGNESLLINHPFLNNLLIWDKKTRKILNLVKLLGQIRATKYQYVINLQRFGASGFLTAFSGATETIGFSKNPFSFLFSKNFPHTLKAEVHELDRNQSLIADFTDNIPTLPRLYPSPDDYERIKVYQNRPYICIAPASVWFTKQYPITKWAEMIANLPAQLTVFLLGGPTDSEVCNNLEQLVIGNNGPNTIINLSGKLSLLQSAALMEKAVQNFVNDSAPLHIATAMEANVCAVFCSTVPEFGFGPIGLNGVIVQTNQKLKCRPCGLHGFKACPEKHFKCAYSINTHDLLMALAKN